MATSEYSEEILNDLTPEERAALLDEDSGEGDSDAGIEAKAEDQAKQDGADEPADEPADDKEDQPAAGAVGDDGNADGGDDAPGAADPEAAGTDPEQPTQVAPLLVADVPADAETKLKEIADQKAALVEQFDNGDITAKEYQTQLDALSKQERDIELKLHKAQLAQEMQQQQRVNAWLAQVNEFTTKTYPEYGRSKFLWTALDMAVKEIGGDPKNADLSGAEILKLAHERVVSDIGHEVFKSRKTEEKAGKPLKGAKAAPPPTLAKVPAADPTEVQDGRWAILDRLAESDPLEYEERLMRLSEADREAYLNRA